MVCFHVNRLSKKQFYTFLPLFFLFFFLEKKKSIIIILFITIVHIGRIDSQEKEQVKKMQISERILLIITAVTTAISALFCVIALATPRWSLISGLYCSGCPTASAGLSIVAFILLVIAAVVIFLFVFRILPNSTRVLSIIVLFIASIFTLSSFAAYWDAYSGYSYKLMVVAHFLCYTASLMAAFWLGTSYVTTITRPN
jgi:hypothetical protein